MKKLSIILVSVLFVFSGCTDIMLKMYGLKSDYTILDRNNLSTLAKKHNIPLGDLYELDTLYYNFIKSYNKDVYEENISNHLQSLQALYFDKNGDLISFHINCYAGGFPNLKWNRDKILDTFVPKTQAPLDSLVTYNNLVPYLQPFQLTEIKQSDYDYIVAIFWADFMGRQSKRLIKAIQKNVSFATKDKRVKIIYVNLDNFKYELAKRQQKEETLQLKNN